MPEIFQLTETNETPKICLNPQTGKFIFSGRSLPEDAIKFYNPILEWVKNYVQKPNNETIVDFNLEYFNSSSARILVKILLELEKIMITGKKVEIVWNYKEGDEVMMDRGDEIKSILQIPFEIRAF